MADEVHFFVAGVVPKIDIQDEHAVINVAARNVREFELFGFGGAYFRSASLPVVASVIMSRTHGGGVIGRRSWSIIS